MYPDGLFSRVPGHEGAVGDRLDVEGPFGTFTLRESRTCRLVFVGGGAGMAPVLGLLRSMAERGIERQAVFYYGARTAGGTCASRRSCGSSRSGCPASGTSRRCPSPPATTGTARSGLITEVVERREPDLKGGMPMCAGRRRWWTRRSPLLTALGVREQNIFYDKFTTTGEPEEARTAHDHRPKTSRNAASRSPSSPTRRRARREFPDSGPAARRYNYFKPAKRKQTHYEDVTVEVQPDPRHYLSQGWIYGFANGEAGYPLNWTKLKAWGVDEPEPQRGVGTGRQAGRRTGPPTAGTSSGTPTRSGR